jgi:hypothetical protein
MFYFIIDLVICVRRPLPQLRDDLCACFHVCGFVNVDSGVKLCSQKGHPSEWTLLETAFLYVSNITIVTIFLECFPLIAKCTCSNLDNFF